MWGLHEDFIEMVAVDAGCLCREWARSIWAKDHGREGTFPTVSLSISFVVVFGRLAFWVGMVSSDSREISVARVSHVVRNCSGKLWWTALQPLGAGTKCAGICRLSDDHRRQSLSGCGGRRSAVSRKDRTLRDRGHFDRSCLAGFAEPRLVY